MKVSKLFLNVAVAAGVCFFQPAAEAQVLNRFPQNVKLQKAVPPKLPKLRDAIGTVMITRSTMTYDEKTGVPIYERQQICKETIPVPVYDVRENPRGAEYTRVTCSDYLGGRSLEIESFVGLDLGKSLMDPNLDVKYMWNATWITTRNGQERADIPRIPDQQSFTTDLNQVYFGTFAFPHQYIVCKTTGSPMEPVEPKLHKAQGDSKAPADCEVVNPVAYIVTWTVEDRQ